MKSKRDIKREYQERVKPAGVFQVKNTVNGKVLLGSSLNLEGPLSSHKFAFEILETVKVKDDPRFNLSDELTLLEQTWLEALQSFGEQGYNTDTNIRQA